MLLHGDRLAGQRRLVDPQLRNLVQAQVGGTRLPASSSTTSPGTRCSVCTCGTRPARRTVACGAASWRSACIAWSAATPAEADDGVEQHDDQDDQGVDQVADQARQHGRGRQQHQDHEVA
jgi:hypothetical protein